MKATLVAIVLFWLFALSVEAKTARIAKAKSTKLPCTTRRRAKTKAGNEDDSDCDPGDAPAEEGDGPVDDNDPEDVGTECKENWTEMGNDVGCKGGQFKHEPDEMLCTVECTEPTDQQEPKGEYTVCTCDPIECCCLTGCSGRRLRGGTS